MLTFSGQSPYGIKYLTKRYFAYVDDRQKGWDAVELVNDAAPNNDPWGDSDSATDTLRHRLVTFWWNIPEINRAWYIEEHCIPYEDILAIDAEGDDVAHCPHVYAETGKSTVSFIMIEYATGTFRSPFQPDPAKRIKYFPDTFPEPTPAPAEPTRPGEDERLRRS
jgi:hypothetical protein